MASVELLKAPALPKKRIFLLIGVFSTGNNFKRRMALRRTWMQYESVRSGEVAVRFFTGLVSLLHSPWVQLQCFMFFLSHQYFCSVVTAYCIEFHLLISCIFVILFAFPAVIISTQTSFYVVGHEPEFHSIGHHSGRDWPCFFIIWILYETTSQCVGNLLIFCFGLRDILLLHSHVSTDGLSHSCLLSCLKVDYYPCKKSRLLSERKLKVRRKGEDNVGFWASIRYRNMPLRRVVNL